jgi:FAD:protein FMN transferase
MKRFLSSILLLGMIWLQLPQMIIQAAEKPEFYEQIYLTESAALKQIFGDLTPQKNSKAITPDQKKLIQKQLRRKISENSFNYWVGLRNGKIERYGLIMDEDGKHFPITFIVGLSPQAKVTQVAVMVYRERRGEGVKRARFLNQFIGKSGKDAIEVNTDIIHITGATISSWSMAAGVRKALVLLEEVILK